MPELLACCNDENGFLLGRIGVSSEVLPAYSSHLPQPAVAQPHHAHVVQFYSQDSFLLDELAKHVGSALGAGDGAVVIATRPHCDGLADRLRALGFDPGKIIDQGTYMPLDAAETLAAFMHDGVPSPERFRQVIGELICRATAAVRQPNPRVVAFGEMVALLWAEGKAQAALQVEQLWNELATSYAFSLRCAYPLSFFNRTEHAESLLQICAAHGAVIPEESYTNLRSEEAKLRAIAELQQKARALETEMSERTHVHQALLASQEALRRSHDELEQRVLERTQELIEAQRALRELSSRLLTLRDEERRRLARELHDSTGQTLAAIQLNLAMVQNSTSTFTPESSKRVADAISLADQAISEVRTLSYLLHPPMLDEAGLLLALEWYIAGFVDRSRIEVSLDLPPHLDRLPHDMEVAVFRIVQEALTNVQRHARSMKAHVWVKRNCEALEVAIEDSGKGIAADVISGKTGVGINGMKERARQFGGELHISCLDPGTRIRVTLPLQVPEAVAQ